MRIIKTKTVKMQNNLKQNTYVLQIIVIFLIDS